MPDSKQDIALRAGLEGTEDIAKAADKALSPWQSGAAKVGGALKSAFAGAVQDVARLVTVAQGISLDRAFESARKYRAEIGILSATAGPVGQLRAQMESISRSKLIRESELVAADRGLGRIVYSTKGALGALGALGDEAQATGETLTDKIPLGATLMNSMGVAGAKVGDELGRIRSMSDALGNSGGLLAAEDRLTAMSGLLSEIGVKADGDRAKLEAMAVGLGKGLNPEAGKRASGNILGTINARREQFEAIAHMKLGSLTDENGNLRVDKAMDAAERVQAFVRRNGKTRGMQQLIASNFFGGDRQAGAAFLNADFGEMRRAALLNPSGKTAAEAAAFRAGEAGQQEARQQEMERNARKGAESLLPIADRAQGLLGQHPIAGGIAANVGINLAGQGLGAVLGQLGQTLIGGGGAMARGGQLAGAAMASGGAAAGASLRAGGGIPGGAVLGKVGAVGAAASVGVAAGTALDEATGISDTFSGTDSTAVGRMRAEDNLALKEQLKSSRERRAKDRRAKADAILAHFKRAGKYYEGGAEQGEDIKDAKGDAALMRLARGASTGAVDVSGLSPEAVNMLTQAIKDGFSNIKIENHSESPVAVNQQQTAGGIKN